MFEWLFGSNKTEEDIINNIFYFTLINNNTQVIKLINDYDIDLNNKNCRDNYSNTLLHIVANSNNIELANELILYGLLRDHLNVYGEKAVDIAFKNGKLAMVRVLTDIQQDPQLLERITNLEIQRQTMYAKIEKTETELVQAHNEIKTLKRKRCDECDVNTRECKKLKTENAVLTKTNEQLTKDNSDLQTTVNNLRTSFKK